jgi:hypothetical protein
MNRLGNKIVSSVLATTAAASLAACGGGSHSAALPRPAPTASASAQYTGPLADATLTITIPVPKSSSTKRRPAYVSASTSKIVFTLNTASNLTASQVTALNTSQLGTQAITLGNAQCPGTGPWTCTFTFRLPPGSDNITVSAQDSASNILSQQIQTLSVTAGGNATGANNFSIVLDANVTTPATSIVINGQGSCQKGPVGATYGSAGTAPQTFTVASTDAQGKTIVGPGLPKIQIQDNTSTYQPASGTINGTGGTVAFTISQAAQSFTLTPSNSSTTGATVNVKVVQADTNGTSDGLAFAHTQSFTFSTGAPPPAHNFLAAVEQFTASTGQVDFFNVTLGGNGALDTITAFTPASLAQTTSTNQPTQKDVDGPVSLIWDNTGDLIIGNGDTTGGNVACVPVGAIATGANSSTTVTTNVDDPVGLAYEPRNGTLAVGNNPANAPQNLAEFVLTGNYTASTNNLKVNNAYVGSGSGTMGQNVVNLPTLAAGTFAIGLYDGCEVDPAQWHWFTTAPCNASGFSEIAILGPTGTLMTKQDTSTFSIDDPRSIAWDAANNELVIANASGWHQSVAFYTLSAGPTLTKKNVIDLSVASNQPYLVATSPDGHVAVAWVPGAGLSGDQVQIYSNNSGVRTPIGGPIEYNATDSSCTNYIYGPGAIPTGLTWLSNTKLMVSLQAFSGGAPVPGKNGLYIYDITSLVAPPNAYDDNSCPALVPVPAAPKQTGFQSITNKPLATAFKP